MIKSNPWLTAFENLGLALMIGGMLALGAFTAPAVFHAFPKEDAGRVMTLIFRRYDIVLTASLILILFVEISRHFRKGFQFSPLPLRRYLVLIPLLLIGIYAQDFIHPQIEQYQKAGVIRGVGQAGLKFDRLHHQSEAFYKLELLFAVLLLMMNSLQTEPNKQA